MTWYKKTAWVLAAVGAINWGLTALGWNAVEELIGSWAPALAMIVYYLVGLSGIWLLIDIFKKK